MIGDALGWAVTDDQKLAFIRQTAVEKAAPCQPRPRARPAQESVQAAVTAPVPEPAKGMKRRKRSTLRPEGSAYTRRSQLCAELKRLAPDKAAKLSYTKVSTEQLEPMVEEAKKAEQR